MRRKYFCAVVILGLLIILFSFDSGPLAAEKFPTKPITLIIQFGPGGGGDQIAQALRPLFREKLGVPLAVEYKPGASAQIGYEIIAAKAEDGYTLGFLTTPHLQLTILTQNPKYNIDTFMPLGTHHMDSVIFYGKKDTPFKDIYDVIQEAKKRPGKITVATGSLKSDMGIAIKALEDSAGVQFSIIPTGGGGKVLSGVLGGHFDIGVHRPTSALGAKDNLKGLAVLSNLRDPNWPETPTFAEALPKEIKIPVVGTWRGLCVRKEVKEKYPDRFDLLMKTFKEVVGSAPYKEIANKRGWVLEYHDPDQTMKIIREDFELMKKFVGLLK